MKKIAQSTVAVLFLLSFIKSFKFQTNAYDIVFILVCACIYVTYELLSEKKLRQDVEKLTIDTEQKFKDISQDIKDTKSYVSTISLSSNYRR